MKLIKEITEELQYIHESSEKTGEKNYYVEGIIMQGDVRNRNGRIYPSKILQKEVKRYNETYIDKRRAYGELGHPEGPTINLDRVSHMFTELKQHGSNIVGKAKVLDTPMGKIVKNLIDEKATLGISSRGLGSVKQNKQGIMEVQDDFVLATPGDIVADPSAPNAFLEGIMENTEWYFDLADHSWKAKQMLEQQITVVNNKYSKISEKQALKMFEQFINSI